MKKAAIVILMCTLLLAGCARESTRQEQFRVVTQVDVAYENGPLQARRHYTQSVKMRPILNYLRWIDPYGLPEEDPEDLAGSSIRITLTYSDGSSKDYVQKGDQYLMEEGKAWRRINPQNAQTLARILGEMESDEL